MTDDLLTCIQEVKQKYSQYKRLESIVEKPETTSEQMKDKIQTMTAAINMLSEENNEVIRLQENLIPILEEKDKMISLKEMEVKRYREQLMDALNKNEELTNYCRKLANEFTTLLSSAKDNEEVAIKRQASELSKLKMMENQVHFLRQNILNKKNLENCEEKTKTQSKHKKCSRQKSEKNLKMNRKNSVGGNEKRKSLIYKLI